MAGSLATVVAVGPALFAAAGSGAQAAVAAAPAARAAVLTHQVARFRAIQDTFVASSRPRTPFAGQAQLKAGHLSRRDRKVTYLEFEVRGLPAHVRSARAAVVLTRTAHHLPPTVRLRAVHNRRWTEEHLTWRNRPRLGRRVSTAHPTRRTTVVMLRGARVARDGNYAFAVTVPGRGLASFRAGAAGTALPTLVVHYVAPMRRNPHPSPSPTPSPSSPAPTPTPSGTPTGTPAPTGTPDPTGTPVPSGTPDPTGTPVPTTPPPTTPPPTTTPPPSSTPAPTTPPTTPPPTTPPPTTPPPTSPPPTSPAPTPSPTGSTGSPAPCSVSAILVPSCGIWWGADPGAYSSMPKDQALADFESQIGRNVAIVHSYHSGAQRFPNTLEISEATQPGANRLLLINWKPELGHTWAQVAAGDPTVDANIDAEAAYIKSHFTRRFFLAIHHEPENEVQETAGSGFTAADYAAMYRHVALRLRADGVSNAVFVMNYMGYYGWGEKPWFNDLYPGGDVVDWIAYDPYTNATDSTQDFSLMANHFHSTWSGFYSWATNFAPGKPLMLAEWGVNTTADATRKPWFFNTVDSELGRYPAIKALVYFDAWGFNSTVDTHVSSSADSLAAYRAVGLEARFNLQVPTS